MTHVTATFAKNNLGEIWEMAKKGPVEVLSNGNPVAVVLSPEEFARLRDPGKKLGRPRRFGLLADKLSDLDIDALLNVDVSEAFKDYMP
jgi:prevent-host-death family protein